MATILDQPAAKDRSGELSGTAPPEVPSVPAAVVTSVKQEPIATEVAAETEELLSVVEGDRVAIKVGDKKLKELQQQCGGCTARMIRVSLHLLCVSFLFICVYTSFLYLYFSIVYTLLSQWELLPWEIRVFRQGKPAAAESRYLTLIK